MKEIKVSFDKLTALHGGNIEHHVMTLAKAEGFPVIECPFSLRLKPDMTKISRYYIFRDNCNYNLYY